MSTEQQRGTVPARWAALAGLAAGALTVGVAELLAAGLQAVGKAGAQPSPVLAVGGAFVDRTPGWLKDFAVSTFGTHDKLVLLSGIGVVLVALALAAGAVAARHRTAGLALVALLGAVAAGAVLTRPGAAPQDVLPILVGTVVGLVTLTRLLDRAADAHGPDSTRGWSRRGLLQGVAVAGGAAVVAGGASRVVSSKSRGVQASRAAVRLPAPVDRQTVPAATQLPVQGITPFRTANRDFYRVDTALSVPQLAAEDWSLRIHGMVDHEVTLDYRELLSRPLVERMVTLNCVSNPVGGDLIGNATWLGLPIGPLLKQAGPSANADMVLSTSVDGMTISTPLAELTDGRDALLAVGMNGEPLPVQHGFPVRMIVPGLYGYVSATKWVVDLEVTRFDLKEAFWTPRGYAAKAPVKISSRIDVPRGFAKVRRGTVPVAGVAWAQHRGISAVDVRVDRGPWQRARLADSPSKDTWRQWVWEWPATDTGQHTLECRVIDAEGQPQVERTQDVEPDGATGLDSVVVTVV